MRIAVTLVLAAGLVAVGLPAAAGRAPRGFCTAKHARTIVENRQARVYTVPTTRRRNGPRETIACLYATDRAAELDDGQYFVAFPPPGMALRGHRLAFGLSIEAEGDFPAETYVSVLDLRESAGTGGGFREVESGHAGHGGQLARIGSIALGARGTVAWIACPASYSVAGSAHPRPNCVRPGSPDQVRTIDPRKPRKPRVLDSGRDIDPGSLRIRGTRASWVAGGKRRHARLPDR